MNYYLTYDLGTTALKTALVADNGTVICISTREYSPQMPLPGHVEMDPQEYWRAVVEGTHQVLNTSHVNSGDITAIGFSSQAQTFVPIDQFGQPLSNALVWLDNRSGEIAADWEARWLTSKQFQQTSGYAWIPPELTLFKIAWLMKHNPKIHQTWKFLCLPDWITYRLTGETVTDSVTARMGGMYNFQTNRWEIPFLDAAGIQVDQLPSVLPPGSVVGVLKSDTASQLGLKEGTRVCTGANDQLVGAIGAGNIRPGIATETTGTALAVVGTTQNLVSDPRVTVGRHAVPDIFYAMAFTNTSAILLTWFRDLCGECQVDYETFLRGIASIPPGCNGVTVLPHFMGGNPPIGNPSARGAFIGLTLSHTRAHLARAIMEACACMLKECLEPIIEHQGKITHLRSFGGAAKNDHWLQIKADMLAVPVERPVWPDTASVGAAILAATAVRQFSTLEEAVESWYQPSRIFLPDPSNYAVYQGIYERYKTYNDLIYGKKQ
jgi:sugar (pentulose or hexulose) kinase